MAVTVGAAARARAGVRAGRAPSGAGGSPSGRIRYDERSPSRVAGSAAVELDGLRGVQPHHERGHVGRDPARG